MLFKKLTGAALLATALTAAACSTPAQDAKPSANATQPMTSQAMTSQAMPQDSMQRTGMFDGLNGKHVSGTAKVGGGQVVLSNFASDEGPDLHIYLTKGVDESAVSAGKELGTVAYDKGSQTFSISGPDASGYDTVVINCDKAKAVFGAARLM